MHLLGKGYKIGNKKTTRLEKRVGAVIFGRITRDGRRRYYSDGADIKAI